MTKNQDASKLKICGIYGIKNIINNNIYIGQSIDIKTRMHSHRSKLNKNKHDNKFLQSDFNKYGKDSFEYLILEQCEKEFLDERERYWIDYYMEKGMAYNISIGGRKDFGKNKYNLNAKAVVCLETNEIYETIKEASEKTGICSTSISKVVRGERQVAGNMHWKYANPENFKKHNADNMHCSEERKLKISEGVKASNKGKQGYWKGKSLSENTKEKISATRKGSKCPSNQGINCKHSKQVKCVETSQVFESIKAAEKATGISGIGKVLDSKKYRAGGFHWEKIPKEVFMDKVSVLDLEQQNRKLK